MSRLVWNAAGERFFESGVDRGVLYPKLGPGVPWNGLVSVNEGSSGGEREPLYFEGVKIADVFSAEDFVASVEAYSSPSEFSVSEGSRKLVPGLYATQQPRSSFGFSYRTLIGNDLSGLNVGYKIHLVYNCTAEPSNKQYQTLNSSVNVPTRQWTFQTVPQPSLIYKPTAHFIFDSTEMPAGQLSAIENVLYGSSGSDPRIPNQSEIITILAGV